MRVAPRHRWRGRAVRRPTSRTPASSGARRGRHPAAGLRLLDRPAPGGAPGEAERCWIRGASGLRCALQEDVREERGEGGLMRDGGVRCGSMVVSAGVGALERMVQGFGMACRGRGLRIGVM
ncbi:hypothetical protein KM043_004491 [Ampulex compressa]|nr:hypothetical protein KM043_004491 [Ampulex compressa]